MHIQVNHGNHVRLGEDVEQRFADIIRNSLDRYGDRITRVEMHLSDENAGKGGDSDKRCMIEVRMANVQPIAVNHSADSWQLAFDGALEKAERALSHAIGKLETH
jgi:ribosome-associated translation inhibitor RaiA